MDQTLPRHDVVLLGIGHTNAHILKMWRMQPIEDARLTCVSNFSVATYSGMLPGVLAGQYRPEQMEIDLTRLCASAGARLIVDRVVGMDRETKCLLFDKRPPLPFDLLSIGIGSVPSTTSGENCRRVLAIKPMQTFSGRLQAALHGLADSQDPVQIAIVGGGVGGIEITLCLPPLLRSNLARRPYELTLLHGGSQLMPGTLASTAESIRDELLRRGVRLKLGTRVQSVDNDRLQLADGREIQADLVILATSARGPTLMQRFGLETDDRGFLRTRPTLQTVGHDDIFAVGDSGTIDQYDLPKAGVYAVRQGPVLWHNIQRRIKDQPLRRFTPQKGFLKLMNLGNNQAIAEYRRRTFRGKWCWRLKDYIDRRFMRMYQDYTPMEMSTTAEPSRDASMRCAGCGGKVGGDVLSNVLQRLEIPHSEHVLLGLDQPDDAAIIRAPGGKPVTVTTDFFAAPFDDPYLVGRIAALNAVSDVFALGAEPFAALTMATIPVGRPRKQEQLLYELMAGSLEEFLRAGTTLAGGHTIEGPRLTLGFTVLAGEGPAGPLTKGQLRAGDHLVLTKPLGTGTLLAAHMQAKCRAIWMDRLLHVMLQPNQMAAQLLHEFEIRAVTDVTGFGLAGHLLEMLRASRLGAELVLDAIPLLPGAAESVQEGIESTLTPANQTAETDMRVAEAVRQKPAFRLLFDPQTSGGLLIAVGEADVKAVLRRLAEISDIPAADIGVVQSCAADARRIIVK